MDNELWKKDSFINPNIPFLFNEEIIEYDMKEAGYSLSREYKLLDKSTLEFLGKLKKERRNIEMGLLEKKDETYKNEKKKAFQLARSLFFEENQLEISDIVSVKKDAIFTTKRCRNREFGSFIEFRPKNMYTSYMQLKLNKLIEFYYSPTHLDVKGFGDNLSYHTDYMLSVFENFFRRMETERPEDVLSFLSRLITKYKRKELEVGYYRQFNPGSEYVLVNSSDAFLDYWEEDKEDLDISYNFYHVLLKLVSSALSY